MSANLTTQCARASSPPSNASCSLGSAANAGEIEALDGGRFQGWQRTGLSFNVVDPAAATGGTAMPVCRYYGNPAYGLDTHFYSASPQECAAVHERWPEQWLLESNSVFQVYLPDTATGAARPGRCRSTGAGISALTQTTATPPTRERTRR
jgi:hypothetical protein